MPARLPRVLVAARVGQHVADVVVGRDGGRTTAMRWCGLRTVAVDGPVPSVG